MRFVALALALTACGGGTTVVGDIDGATFGNRTKAYFGGEHLIIIDEADCIELPWVAQRYFDGINPFEGRTYTALQMSERAGEEPTPGVYGLGNDSPVKVFGLNGMGDDFDVHPGREGSIELLEISERGIKGTFEIAFTTGGVAGEFDAEFCLNLL
ncbi:MAG: hypothetical protein EP330_00445 [Deltaproteobacteria bacterium]|nr:MAG: hypothetical protein EP330_00445 [Deltaproteobacteria bacterium]